MGGKNKTNAGGDSHIKSRKGGKMDLSLIAQGVTAVVVSLFGLIKAVQGLYGLFKRK